LNAKNKIMALRMLTEQVHPCSLEIIERRLEELNHVDGNTNKIIIIHGLKHPRAGRLQLCRNEGANRAGIVSIVTCLKEISEVDFLTLFWEKHIS
jgi:hypothetical protein